MILTKGQEEGLKIAVDRYKEGAPFVTIAGYAGTGKAQPVDTIIPTPDGNKRLGDIKVGDYVFDMRGKPTKVLSVHPQGIIDNYKVTLEDGRFTYCNGEHLWSYYTSKGNLCTKTTSQMIKNGLKHNGKGTYKYKIPNIFYPVEYNNSIEKLSIDPYVIGTFLGDGCCLERLLTISSADEELVKEVASLIGAKGYKRQSEKNYNWTFYLSDEMKKNNKQNTYILTRFFFEDYFEEICTSSDKKRIPEVYKYSTVENRYHLIQGLLDTDGTISAKDGNRFNIRYTSINYNLIKDIQEVLYSLGIKSSITLDKRKDKYKTQVCYELSICLPNEEKYKLFRLSRKKEIALKAKEYHKRKNYSKIAIVNIEKMDTPKEMICIYVDNLEHLYLTNDYIVTHNTTLVKTLVQCLPNINPDTDICYCALTGKACQVLSKMGNKNVSTLHRLLFDYRPKPTGGFIRIPRPRLDYPVIVVDECSMVPQEFVNMLLSYSDVFIIFLGDPFQLPPVKKDDGNYLLDSPHIFLSEIMRQEKNNDIIDLTMKIRAGEYIKPQNGTNAKVFAKKDLNTGMLEWADIIICATNATRNKINKQMRELKGFEDKPCNGEKIICLQNNWERYSIENTEPLVNGLVGHISNVYTSFNPIPEFFHSNISSIQTVVGNFVSETGENYGQITMDRKQFDKGEETLDWKTKYKLGKSKYKSLIPEQFTYGYAITCHRSQGSQWEKVLVIEEGFPYSAEEHARWLYTGCSRSSQKLVLIRNI